MARKAMVLDLRRCAGCGACVVACQHANNQQPGLSWVTMDVIEWGEEIGESGRAYIPHACMHCVDPPCVPVCPVGATTQGDDGVVTVDYEACIACGACITACPYNARVMNTTEKNYFDADEQAPYEAYGIQRTNTAEKCMFCEDLVADGREPACVHDCPGRARFFGDMDDPESPVSKKLAEGEAIRIDETSFYYIPVNGMDENLLPVEGSALFGVKQEGEQRADVTPTKSEKREDGTTKNVVEDDSGVNGAAVAAGVVGVAAVGTGIGYAVKKNKEKQDSENKSKDEK